MDLEQAIGTALEFENNVFSVYKEAQEKSSDPIGKRVFGVLAKEEAGHIKYLKDCLEHWKKQGKLTVGRLETVVPPQQRIEEGVAVMKAKVETEKKADPLELRLLEGAVKAEEETSNFYRRMVSEMDEEGQQLFSRFLEIEEGHVAIVRAELDSLNGPGYWFDVQEWRFSDG